MKIVLRDDQQRLKDDIYADWSKGHRNVLAVLPTGGGKSVIVSDIVLDGAGLNMAQAVIAHRNELVSQMSIHIANRGIPHRIIGSSETVAQITRLHRKRFNGQSFINPSAKTGVVGVDTMIARGDTLKDWAVQIDRWITDEAHHVLLTNKWGKAVEMFPRAHGLGVTATPERPDGQGLGAHTDGVFHSLARGLNMRQLIDLGALCDYEIVCPQSDLIMTEEDVTPSGDFSPKKMKAKAEKSRIVGDVVDAYLRYAPGKQAIVFATDVETSGRIAAKFNEAGIRAASLCATTPFAVREKFIEEFKAGILKALVNVDLFDEGFDVPACEVVIMARPTASFVKYSQQFGRVLRTALGKRFGLVIDLVSNVKRHGLPDKVHYWTLDRRDKRGKNALDPDDLPLTTCKSCSRPYEPFLPLCPHCGAEPPLPGIRERTVEMVEGDLMLLDAATLAKMREAAILEAPGDIGSRVVKAAGDFAARGAMARQIEKIAAQERLKAIVAQWAAVERARGYSDSIIHRKLYLASGLDLLSALALDNRQKYDDLSAKIEGWYK